jgi:hypothetical protein
MKDMEDVLELMVPSVLLWNLNIYLLYAGMTYVYIFCVIFIVAMFLVIWYKFSSNIGMITPLLLPLSFPLLIDVRGARVLLVEDTTEPAEADAKSSRVWLRMLPRSYTQRTARWPLLQPFCMVALESATSGSQHTRA